MKVKRTLRSLAFFGNRYGSLSRAFFCGVVAAIEKDQVPVELVLVDTSTPVHASLKTRLRNCGVSFGKQLLSVETKTETMDWFKEPIARPYRKLIPANHDLASANLVRQLINLQVEAILVAGCDQILREPLMTAVPRIINFHNSLLPAYRGCNAIDWAFLNREVVSGYSFHTIESESVDQGVLVFQKALRIEPHQSPSEYSRLVIEDAASNLDKVIAVALGDKWPPAGQRLSRGSYYSAKRMLKVRTFNPELPIIETLHRWRVLGSLDVPCCKIPLRFTDLRDVAVTSEAVPDSVSVGAWTKRRSEVTVQCLDGSLTVTSINYLPAALLAWALPDVIEDRDVAT